jgi:hypothetical protein
MFSWPENSRIRWHRRSLGRMTLPLALSLPATCPLVARDAESGWGEPAMREDQVGAEGGRLPAPRTQGDGATHDDCCPCCLGHCSGRLRW